MTESTRFLWCGSPATLPSEHHAVIDCIATLQPSYKSDELHALAHRLTANELSQVIQLTSELADDARAIARLKNVAMALEQDSEEVKAGRFALECFFRLLELLAERTEGSEINDFVQALSRAPIGVDQGLDSMPPDCAHLLPLARRFAWLRVGPDDRDRVVSSLSESELCSLRSAAQAAYKAGHVHAILKFPRQRWSSDTADLANLVSILSHTGGFTETD